MTELANEPDVAAFIPIQEVASSLLSEPEAIRQSFDWKQAGKIALGGAAAAVVFIAPITARSVTAVENMPPSHIPMTVGGARVDAELTPGQDTIKLEVLGHAFVHRSNLMFGRKHYGVDVIFHTDSSAATLLKTDGTPDNQKIESLINKFSDVTPQEHEIQDALTADITRHVERSAAETIAVEAALLGLYVFSRRRRASYTENQREFSSADRRPAAIATILALGVAGGLPIIQAGQYYWSANHHETVAPDPAFSGTALVGWAVHGPFAGLIDLGWKNWNQTAEKKNAFYQAEVASFKHAFMNKYGSEQLEKPANTKRILFLDDLQAMDGPTLVIGEAAKAYNVDFIVIGGDTEDSDTPYISVLDGLHEHAKGIKEIIATGAHDPANFAKLAEEHGFTVADNTTQNVDGVPFLAGADASTFESFAADQNLIRKGYTDSDVRQTLVDKACSSDKPVIVVVHDNKIGTPVAKTGCASLVLTGRSYTPGPPVDYGSTVEITSGSTGGHNFNEGLNLTGIIANQAPFQIIDVDNKTLQFKSMTKVIMDPVPKNTEGTTTPSTSVTIGETILRTQLTKQRSVAASSFRPLSVTRVRSSRINSTSANKPS